MAGTTAGREGGSTEAGSPRPECGRAGEPRNRRPGSGRTAGRGARSAKSRLVRQRGPAESERHTGSNTLSNCPQQQPPSQFHRNSRRFQKLFLSPSKQKKRGGGDRSSTVRKSANLIRETILTLIPVKYHHVNMPHVNVYSHMCPMLCDTVGSSAAA